MIFSKKHLINLVINSIIFLSEFKNVDTKIKIICPIHGIFDIRPYNFINSQYGCPICGCIDDENRTSQEEFRCIECGYESNADINAAINIKNRVSVTVLRSKLLKQMNNDAYEPRKVKKEKVKEVLLSFRRDLIKGSESRCIHQ